MFFQVGLCNEFLRESTPEKLASRGHSGFSAEVNKYRAEARFIRALSYYHGIEILEIFHLERRMMHLGLSHLKRAEKFVFDYILSELDAIDNQLSAPTTGQYGRADQAAAWMLKAKLLLNAKVYTGQDRSAGSFSRC
ncbi:MAG: hypothetical protein H6584_03040 [Flavobacteriales bacterium]|nr:hypothetical protein [Flavobacteriales bacterium]